MRRPPYSRKVMRGILLIWKKMRISIEMGYIPASWSPQDQRDVKRALQWLGAFFDWVEWREAEKVRLEREKEEEK